MKTELELNEMILGLTNKIRETAPELLEHLNEMPITVPYQENPAITVETLTSYHESLLVLFDEYQINEAKIIPTNTIENLPITEIVTMELNNAYQNLLTEVNNVAISYHEVGEGEIPILFLHGFPFDKSMWKGQLDHLKNVTRLLAIDIRGFGKSTDETTPLSIDLFTEDLIAFMDKLNIKKAIVCGLSMGGYIALNAVKNFPERFEALILCDTQCVADTTEGKENRYKVIEQIKENSATEFNEKFIKNVFHPDSISSKTEVVKNLSDVVFANSKEIMMSGLTALAERSETCSSLKDIHIHTLIICGKQDTVTPLAQSEFMNLNIKDSILNIIDNAGHVSNLEQPEAFNKHLSDFLKSFTTISNSL